MSNPDAIFVLVPYDGQGTTTEVLQIMNRVVFQGSKYIYIYNRKHEFTVVDI